MTTETLPGHQLARRRLTLAAAMLFFSAMFCGALISMAHFHTGVLQWDGWEGVGWFYVRTASEGWAPWWEQGNEHRFLLSRILFWVEFHFFGDLKFLLAMNVVLLLAISGVFSLLIRRSGMAQEGAVSPGALTLFIAGAAFSWMQQENLRWEVASQIYLAHLLPLLAFYWMARYCQTGRGGFFKAALVGGFLSIATMANGVATLPMLVLWALLYRLPARQILLTGFVSALAMWTYFHGYTSPHWARSPPGYWLERPVDVLQFLFAYFGAPFFHLTGSVNLAVGTGVFFVMASAIGVIGTIVQSVRLRRPGDPMLVAISFFLVYVGASGLAAALSRAHIGLPEAFASRYATSTLLGWLALLLLAYAHRPPTWPWARWALALPVFVAAGLLLNYQIRACQDKTTAWARKSKEWAALAMALDIPDKSLTSLVYYNAVRGPVLARRFLDDGLGIFGRPPYSLIGSNAPTTPHPPCDGRITHHEPVEQHPDFWRVEGWITTEPMDQAHRFVRLMQDDRIVGHALLERPFVLGSGPSPQAGTAFFGYVQATAKAGPITVAKHQGCAALTGLS